MTPPSDGRSVLSHTGCGAPAVHSQNGPGSYRGPPGTSDRMCARSPWFTSRPWSISMSTAAQPGYAQTPRERTHSQFESAAGIAIGKSYACCRCQSWKRDDRVVRSTTARSDAATLTCVGRPYPASAGLRPAVQPPRRRAQAAVSGRDGRVHGGRARQNARGKTHGVLNRPLGSTSVNSLASCRYGFRA